MDNEKFRRVNLRYVVECRRSWSQTSEYYWVYHSGKSFYVKGPWPKSCHYSVRSVEDLTRWIENNYYTCVIRVIPEKDLKRESCLQKDRANIAGVQEKQMNAASMDDSTKQTFMARLPKRIARLVGGTSVVTFKSPSSNIRWGTKRRSRS